MSYREPQSWKDFRVLLAEAMRKAGYHDVAVHAGDTSVEDQLAMHMYRLWEAISWDEGAHQKENVDLWVWYEDELYNFLTDYASEWNNRWNYEPGAAPEKLDIGQFARQVTSELVGRKYDVEEGRFTPTNAIMMLEADISENHNSSGIPSLAYFKDALQQAMLSADQDRRYLDAISSIYDSPEIEDVYNYAKETRVSKNTTLGYQAFWRGNRALIMNLVADLIFDVESDDAEDMAQRDDDAAAIAFATWQQLAS